MRVNTTLILLAIFILNSCTEVKKDETLSIDPLPSWNEGKTKKSIINFVKEITNFENEYFVPVPDRIAVFDNDGNLWSEKPVYFQLFLLWIG